MDADDLFDNRQRFAAVMKARRGDKELLELFHKLVLSDKFSDGAKPYCYADLVVEAARRIADNNLSLLMQTMEERSAAKKIRTGIPHEKAEVAMRALMKRVFASTPVQPDPMLKVFLWSERAGVAMDRGHTICLGLEGGITVEVMDDICDLTIYQYYPCMPRPKPRLQAQPQSEAKPLELLAA
jgi:hypothetical protein